MKKKAEKTKSKTRPRSLGDLIASVYDDVSRATDDVNLAARVTAREVTRWLVRAGRPDLALELADGRV